VHSVLLLILCRRKSLVLAIPVVALTVVITNFSYESKVKEIIFIRNNFFELRVFFKKKKKKKNGSLNINEAIN
jgi:hypothetical protein